MARPVHLTAVAALLATAMGHICVIYPPQRGDALPNPITPGEDLCYRRTPYCGGVDLPKMATTSFLAGAPAELVFQQNLNHFWPGKPGAIDVSISYNLDPEESDFTTLLKLYDYAGNEMVTQTNFSRTVMMPSKAAKHAILRFRYISHNEGEIDPANNTDSIFYNCADVELIENSAAAHTTATEQTPAVSATSIATGCSTPNSWMATAFETTANGVVFHQIYYSQTVGTVRWDRSGPLYQSGVDVSLTTLALYNQSIPGQPPAAHPEYLIDPTKSTCVLYGADPMYAWEYGPSRNQVLVREFTDETGSPYQEWATPDNAHHFIVSMIRDGICIPEIETHPTTQLAFQKHVVGPIEESIFAIPHYCKKPIIGHGIKAI